MCNTKVYRCWASMKARCDGVSKDNKKYYKDRGITYCKSWSLFLNFYADMGDPTQGMSIDRIDNDKGYSKNNCRWATSKEQQNNRRHVSKWKIQKNNTSGFQGIDFLKDRNKWRVRINKKFLGHFKTLKQAMNCKNKFLINNGAVQ